VYNNYSVQNNNKIFNILNLTSSLIEDWLINVVKFGSMLVSRNIQFRDIVKPLNVLCIRHFVESVFICIVKTLLNLTIIRFAVTFYQLPSTNCNTNAQKKNTRNRSCQRFNEDIRSLSLQIKSDILRSIRANEHLWNFK